MKDFSDAMDKLQELAGKGSTVSLPDAIRICNSLFLSAYEMGHASGHRWNDVNKCMPQPNELPPSVTVFVKGYNTDSMQHEIAAYGTGYLSIDCVGMPYLKSQEVTHITHWMVTDFNAAAFAPSKELNVSHGKVYSAIDGDKVQQVKVLSVINDRVYYEFLRTKKKDNCSVFDFIYSRHFVPGSLSSAYLMPVVRVSATGEVLNRYDSVPMAALELNIARTHVQSLCISKFKSFGTDFLFYEKDFKEGAYLNKIAKIKSRNEMKGYHEKPVVQLTLDGEYINTFSTMREAGERLDIDPSYISKCVRKIRAQAEGYAFVSKEDYEKPGFIFVPSTKTKYQKIVALNKDAYLIQVFNSVYSVYEDWNINKRMLYATLKASKLRNKAYYHKGYWWMLKTEYDKLPAGQKPILSTGYNKKWSKEEPTNEKANG